MNFAGQGFNSFANQTSSLIAYSLIPASRVGGITAKARDAIPLKLGSRIGSFGSD